MNELNMATGNKTYEYGINLYIRWCKENDRPLISESEKDVKDFLIAHRKGWPTKNPKTLQTVRMRLQALRKFYEINGSEVDFKPLAKKLKELSDLKSESDSEE